NETLVLAELLDRRVTLQARPVPEGEAAPPGVEVTVLDAAIEQERGGDWVVDQVAVRVGRGRRGEVRTVAWDEVAGFSLPEDGQGAANLLAAFERLRPADLASLLHDLSRKRRAEVAAALDDERLADVLEELPEDEQVELLGGLADERAADVLEAMGPDDAADLL
nr:magnesium transporter [Micromonospora sp. DSM 115978]